MIATTVSTGTTWPSAERAAVQVAVGLGLDGEDRLVGLDLQDLLALLDLGAVFHQPLDQGDLFHGLAELGDEDFFCHQLDHLSARGHDAADVRDRHVFQDLGARHRHVGAATRTIGASSQSKASSLTCAITSLMKLVFS